MHAATASITIGSRTYQSPQMQGLLWGLLGVIGFSGSLPMTKLAVADLNPWFISLGRAVVAGVLAALLLAIARPRRPTASEWRWLLLVVIGVVIGFPVFSTLALQHVSASHGSVINGTLPLATAVTAAWLAGERHKPAFWAWAVAGCTLVIGFALWRNWHAVGQDELALGDLLMMMAVAIGALGYVAGGRVSKTLGGWQTICWALVIALPFLIVPAWLARPQHVVPTLSWACFGYVSVISMFLGFFAWYHGLALGGIARVGQVQLLQPFFSLLLSALLLGEVIPVTMWLVVAGVVTCIAFGRRA